MTNANVNYSLIRYQADNIPLFDGNTKHICRFISACENFLEAHLDRVHPNAPLNIALFDTILSKLTGRAADLIASRIELNNWNLVKEAIKTTFSDQRSIDCVVQDIITMKPHKHENSLQFGIRLQDARSLLYSKINASNDPREVKLLKITEYGKLTTKTFINGLDYNMQLVIRLKNPQSVEEAITHAVEEENFIYFRNRQASNHKISPQPNSLLQTMSHNKNNYQHHSQPSFHTTNYNNNAPVRRPLFSSPFQQNAYLRPNFTPQAFNQPRNVYPYRNDLTFKGYGQFKPRSGQSRTFNQNFNNRPTMGPTNQNSGIRHCNPPQNQNFNRGEPMDISSGNTIINRALRQAINPQNRNFVSQELFNQSVELPNKSSTETLDIYPNNTDINSSVNQTCFETQLYDNDSQIDYNQFNENELSDFQNYDYEFANPECPEDLGNVGNFPIAPLTNYQT